jgi:hypothetical protein
MAIRASVSAGVLGLVVAMPGCGSPDPNGPEAIADCVAKERSGYPALKAAAERAMPPSASIRFADRSGWNCEDSLTPRPAATAIMDEWHTRQDAISYLESTGWRFVGQGGGLTKGDQSVWTSVTQVTTAKGRVYVYVLFTGG